MSQTTHGADASEHAPDAAGHGHDEHGGNDEHGGHGPALGPIDWRAWGAGILGVAAGLAVAAALYVSTAL